jgi:hypothetical protein
VSNSHKVMTVLIFSTFNSLSWRSLYNFIHNLFPYIRSDKVSDVKCLITEMGMEEFVDGDERWRKHVRMCPNCQT